jgi:hypothetical protein
MCSNTVSYSFGVVEPRIVPVLSIMLFEARWIWFVDLCQIFIPETRQKLMIKNVQGGVANRLNSRSKYGTKKPKQE